MKQYPFLGHDRPLAKDSFRSTCAPDVSYAAGRIEARAESVPINRHQPLAAIALSIASAYEANLKVREGERLLSPHWSQSRRASPVRNRARI
jgi:hypothetical protein